MDKVVKWTEAVAITIAAVFAPIGQLLLAAGILIVVDLISGISAAKKRGEEITSSGLKRTIVKGLVYELALMLAFITEHYISGVLPFTKMVSAMVAVTELKSVYENLNDISQQKLLAAIIDKLDSSQK